MFSNFFEEHKGAILEIGAVCGVFILFFGLLAIVASSIKPKSDAEWKQRLPKDATEIVDQGNYWATFKMDGRKFLIRGSDFTITRLD